MPSSAAAPINDPGDAKEAQRRLDYEKYKQNRGQQLAQDRVTGRDGNVINVNFQPKPSANSPQANGEPTRPPEAMPPPTSTPRGGQSAEVERVEAQGSGARAQKHGGGGVTVELKTLLDNPELDNAWQQQLRALEAAQGGKELSFDDWNKARDLHEENLLTGAAATNEPAPPAATPRGGTSPDVKNGGVPTQEVPPPLPETEAPEEADSSLQPSSETPDDAPPTPLPAASEGPPNKNEPREESSREKKDSNQKPESSPEGQTAPQSQLPGAVDPTAKPEAGAEPPTPETLPGAAQPTRNTPPVAPGEAANDLAGTQARARGPDQGGEGTDTTQQKPAEAADPRLNQPTEPSGAAPARGPTPPPPPSAAPSEAPGIGASLQSQRSRLQRTRKALQNELAELSGGVDNIFRSKTFSVVRFFMPGLAATVTNAIQTGKAASEKAEESSLEARLVALKTAHGLLAAAQDGASFIDGIVTVVRWIIYTIETVVVAIIIALLSPILILVVANFYAVTGTGKLTKAIGDLIKKLEEIIKPLEERLAKVKKRLTIRRQIKQIDTTLNSGQASGVAIPGQPPPTAPGSPQTAASSTPAAPGGVPVTAPRQSTGPTST